MSDPKLPDELWGVFCANGELVGTGDSAEECEHIIEIQGVPRDKVSVALVGVNPAWRARAERAEAALLNLKLHLEETANSDLLKRWTVYIFVCEALEAAEAEKGPT